MRQVTVECRDENYDFVSENDWLVYPELSNARKGCESNLTSAASRMRWLGASRKAVAERAWIRSCDTEIFGSQDDTGVTLG